jgi:molybdate transport system substrate-binding protein
MIASFSCRRDSRPSPFEPLIFLIDAVFRSSMSAIPLPPLRVLSAGAPRAGVGACIDAFAGGRARAVAVEFSPAPGIEARMQSPDPAAEIVIATVPAVAEFRQRGLLAASASIAIGSVRTAVVVRAGAPAPDIGSPEALRAALLEADAVVFNRASSGRHIETMLEHLGVAGAIARKITRTDTGEGVVERLASGVLGRAIGFAQMTEIARLAARGVSLVGPLPDELGKSTTYEAAVLAGASADADARALIAYLASAAGRQTLSKEGLE